LAQRLPLHLACKKGLSREIIAALLHADKDGKGIRRETKSGRRALHIALESKLDGVIEDLLIADTRLNNIDVDFNSDDDDIYQTYHGLTPLHYACLIGTKTDVVRLLLEKDGRNQTIFQTVECDGESSFSLDRLKDGDIFQTAVEHDCESVEHDCESSYSVDGPNDGDIFQTVEHDGESSYSVDGPNDGDDTSRNTRSLLAQPVTLCIPRGIRPLYVALVNNSVETSRLILQHEKQASTTIEHRQHMAESVDVHGRTCLHLACMNNMESEIIRMLLDLDPSRISTSLQDDKGCTPLLRICMHTQ
jgi:ankyrin repeat protein